MSRTDGKADRHISNILRIGKVASVDAGTSSAIVDFGDFKSPLIQVGQMRAGAIQFWWMPSTGEQVLVGAPSGDFAQGIIICSIYANNAPSADSAVPMINLNGGKMTVNGDIIVTGDVIASGVSLVNHTHPESIGSNTGKPS